MEMFTDYKQAIICPYCFRTFSHQEVHFRMESYFDQNNLNDEGYQDEDFQTPGVVPEQDKTRLLQQTEERRPFLIKDDPLYTEWWTQYGDTTEQAYGIDSKLPCKVYQLPILNPSDPVHQKSLQILQADAIGAERYLGLDADGMAASVVDRFGQETRRRVCPHCHNPLPINYGKNNVQFISVIGITGSGKTVYLSQLLNGIQEAVASLNMTATATTDIANFIMSNPVEEGKPLPPASVEGRFLQPMVYDLSRSVTNTAVQTETIVLYDIAGEDCQSPNAMLKYGKFVQNSNAILLLIDPQKQLDLKSKGAVVDGRMRMAPQVVLDTIHNVFLKLPGTEKCRIPLAVCVSKSDTFLNYIKDPEAKKIADSDIIPLRDERTQDYIPEFNTEEYNKLNQEIRKLTKGPLMAVLKVEFLTYNFFAFSATGCATEVRTDENSGESYQYLTGPAAPKRIAEPLFWIFCKLGYIKPHTPILRPVPGVPEKWYEVEIKTGFFHKEKRMLKESDLQKIEYGGGKVLSTREMQPPAEYLESLKFEE